MKGDGMSEGHEGGHHKFTIKIDKETFHVEATAMTGQELRELPSPPIGPDRDLFLVVPGPAEDILVGSDQSIELKDGMHFFTAPSTINPGVDAPTR
jgi:Multiubiquitin